MQHAVTFAAGLACEGMIPFAAIYSSFLQRGYDQIVHDVCLQSLPGDTQHFVNGSQANSLRHLQAGASIFGCCYLVKGLSSVCSCQRIVVLRFHCSNH